MNTHQPPNPAPVLNTPAYTEYRDAAEESSSGESKDNSHSNSELLDDKISSLS